MVRGFGSRAGRCLPPTFILRLKELALHPRGNSMRRRS